MNYRIYQFISYLSLALIFMMPVQESFAAVIGIPIREYPIIEDQHASDRFVSQLQQSGVTLEHRLQHLQRHALVSGIFGTYAGYLSVSDNLGYLLFPRLHQDQSIYLILTPKMTPIVMFGNTIHHWEFQEGVPAKMYKAERIHDEQTKLLYWDIKEVPLPADKIIPSTKSVLILAKPNDFYIPEGISIATNSPHLIIPDIYVKRTINRVASTLYILNLNLFFGTVFEKAKADKKDLMLLIHP